MGLFKSKKHVFWEALFLTIVVFMFGLLLGISLENRRVDKINEAYAKSEISLMDILAMERILEIDKGACEDGAGFQTANIGALPWAVRVPFLSRKLERRFPSRRA